MLFRALYISESEALDSIYSLLFTKLNGTLMVIPCNLIWLGLKFLLINNNYSDEARTHDYVELNTCIQYISIKILAECVIVYQFKVLFNKYFILA